MTAFGFDANRYQQRSHLTAGCLCAVFAGLQYFASTGRPEIARVEREAILSEQKQLSVQSEALRERLAALKLQEGDLQTQMQSVRRRIPYSSGEHAFLEQVAGDAEACGVEIQELRPGETALTDQLHRTQLRITAACAYSGLCRFLAQLRGMERLCSVEECRITVRERGQDRLSVELTLAVFSAAPVDVAESVRGSVR